MGKYFGTDGVRGEANVELTPELAFKLGRFGGYVLSQHETGRPKVFVARDTRISGEMLESALVAGPQDFGRGRPCLNYYIKQCCAPCRGHVSQKEYAEAVQDALDFIRGGARKTKEG